MEDLIEACNYAIYEYTGSETGIKRRQIFEDIKFMESPQGWNVPLEHYRDGHKVYYRYSDLYFSINNQPLNATEHIQLKEALLTLSRFKGMPQFEWVAELSARLDSSLGLNSNKSKVIEFDENTYLKGKEYFTSLYNGIIHRQALKIVYQSFKSTDSESILFHPYYLKQYNNRWFVLGKNQFFDNLQTLALDRISKIDETALAYVPNDQIDFQEYFEDSIGVSVNHYADPEKVEIDVYKELYPYIETKPLHGSQKVTERNSSKVKITLDLKLNYELESLILSYGEGLKVISPVILRDRIKRRIEMMNQIYQT
jgi:predicted DNA-binding transcriptional regulator YafY